MSAGVPFLSLWTAPASDASENEVGRSASNSRTRTGNSHQVPAIRAMNLAVEAGAGLGGESGNLKRNQV